MPSRFMWELYLQAEASSWLGNFEGSRGRGLLSRNHIALGIGSIIFRANQSFSQDSPPNPLSAGLTVLSRTFPVALLSISPSKAATEVVINTLDYPPFPPPADR